MWKSISNGRDGEIRGGITEKRRGQIAGACFETLESRQLLSVSVPDHTAHGLHHNAHAAHTASQAHVVARNGHSAKSHHHAGRNLVEENSAAAIHEALAARGKSGAAAIQPSIAVQTLVADSGLGGENENIDISTLPAASPANDSLAVTADDPATMMSGEDEDQVSADSQVGQSSAMSVLSYGSLGLEFVAMDVSAGTTEYGTILGIYDPIVPIGPYLVIEWTLPGTHPEGYIVQHVIFTNDYGEGPVITAEYWEEWHVEEDQEPCPMDFFSWDFTRNNGDNGYDGSLMCDIVGAAQFYSDIPGFIDPDNLNSELAGDLVNTTTQPEWWDDNATVVVHELHINYTCPTASTGTPDS